MIPTAAGIGGEVIVACTECQKLMTVFIKRCIDEESTGVQVDTFRSFCESYRDKNSDKVNVDFCLILNAKMASVTGETGTEILDPTKAPNVCIKFRNGKNKY